MDNDPSDFAFQFSPDKDAREIGYQRCGRSYGCVPPYVRTHTHKQFDTNTLDILPHKQAHAHTTRSRKSPNTAAYTRIHAIEHTSKAVHAHPHTARIQSNTVFEHVIKMNMNAGRRLLALAAADPEVDLVQAIEYAEHPLQGKVYMRIYIHTYISIYIYIYIYIQSD